MTGVVFLVTWAGVASGAASPALNVAFSVAVVPAWSWIAALSAHLMREAA